jgi:hypothetical protein
MHVIFDNNQHHLYIYDKELTKIIDVQKCENLYSINQFGSHFYYNIPFSGISHKYENFF